MWLMPLSTARRKTLSASSLSRGGPKTLSPDNCIAPYPIRWTRQEPTLNDPAAASGGVFALMPTPRPVGRRGSDPLAFPASATVRRYEGPAHGGRYSADEEGNQL